MKQASKNDKKYTQLRLLFRILHYTRGIPFSQHLDMLTEKEENPSGGATPPLISAYLGSHV